MKKSELRSIIKEILQEELRQHRLSEGRAAWADTNVRTSPAEIAWNVKAYKGDELAAALKADKFILGRNTRAVIFEEVKNTLGLGADANIEEYWTLIDEVSKNLGKVSFDFSAFAADF